MNCGLCTRLTKNPSISCLKPLRKVQIVLYDLLTKHLNFKGIVVSLIVISIHQTEWVQAVRFTPFDILLQKKGVV